MSDWLGYASIPRDAEGRWDGFHVVGAHDRAEEWVARRDDPACSPPARPRSSYPDPIDCGWCGARFCPLRNRAQTRFCSQRCKQKAYVAANPDRVAEWSRRSRERQSEAQRRMATERFRDRRRQRRREDPAFREREARHAREYRKRKREAARAAAADPQGTE